MGHFLYFHANFFKPAAEKFFLSYNGTELYKTNTVSAENQPTWLTCRALLITRLKFLFLIKVGEFRG